MPSATYLYRRGNVWYFRRTVPRRLQKFFSNRLVRVSLARYMACEARSLARRLNAVVDRIFAALDELTDEAAVHVARVGDMTDRLIKAAFQAILDEAETARALAPRRDLATAEAARAAHLSRARDLQAALACNDLDPALQPLSRAADDIGLSFSPATPEGRVTARKMLRAQIQAAQINADREMGLYEEDQHSATSQGEAALSGRSDPSPTSSRWTWSGTGAAMPPSTPPPRPFDAVRPVAVAQPASPDEPAQAAPAPQTVEEAARALADIRGRKEQEQRQQRLSRTVSETVTDLETRLYDEQGKWKKSTRDSVQNAATLWIKLKGDCTLAEVDDEAVDDFISLLNMTPRTYDKNPAYRDRPLAALAREIRGWSPKKRAAELVSGRLTLMGKETINKHLMHLGRVFKDAGLADDNPFRGKLYRADDLEPEDTQRREWSPEAKQAFFTSPLYTGCKSAQRRSTPGPHVIQDGLFWGPLLADLMGLRQQEAAQLFVSDVKVIEGIAVVDLVADEGRRLKNARAHRRIPIPQFLIEIGFLDFVERQRRAGETALFPELHENGPGRSGEALRKRFDYYKKPFVDPDYVFHGIRHGFITALMNADGVSQHLVESVAGHKLKSQTGSRYFKGFELQALKKAMDSLAPEALEHLKRRC